MEESLELPGGRAAVGGSTDGRLEEPAQLPEAAVAPAAAVVAAVAVGDAG